MRTQPARDPLAFGRLMTFMVLLAFGSATEAANLSIEKKLRLDLGEKTFPLGAPTNEFYGAYPARDGGYLLVGPHVIPPTNYAWQRFGPLGGIVWSNSLPVARPDALAEMKSGEFACLAYPVVSSTPPRHGLFVISADGTAFAEHELPKPRTEDCCDELDYTALLAETDGLLVGGYAGDYSYGNQYSSRFVMKLSADYNRLWQHELYPFDVNNLALGTGGAYLVGNAAGVLSVATNGVIQWRAEMYGDNPRYPPVSLLRCNDGGVLVGFSSEALTGHTKTAPFYGGSDIWLVRLHKSGYELWQRSFGGAGWESLLGVQQTEDGGFLVVARTTNSQVSGNKAVDGDGLWLLKLTERGFKEGEWIIQSDPLSDQSSALLPAPVGFRLAVTSWIADLAVRRMVEIHAEATGTPFALDYSADLLNWTNLLTRFNGVLSLEEDTFPLSRFYRCREVP